ncbi:MAG: SPOR domain-containing protein [Pseudomonadota bacterium]
MKSRASLALLALVAGAVVAQEPPAGTTPRGSSNEARYDAVGYAGIGTATGISVVSTALPVGSFAEVTAIDTGRVTLVAVVGGDLGAGQLVELSPGAAAALGVTRAPVAVRVRPIVVGASDIGPLRAGQAVDRGEAPPPLLAALRRKLGAVAAPRSTAAPPPVRATAPVAAPPRVVGDGYVVQVATLSDAGRAKALAARIGGAVTPVGKLFRVRSAVLGGQAAAARERARIAGLGYADARVVRFDP